MGSMLSYVLKDKYIQRHTRGDCFIFSYTTFLFTGRVRYIYMPEIQ